MHGEYLASAAEQCTRGMDKCCRTIRTRERVSGRYRGSLSYHMHEECVWQSVSAQCTRACRKGVVPYAGGVCVATCFCPVHRGGRNIVLPYAQGLCLADSICAVYLGVFQGETLSCRTHEECVAKYFCAVYQGHV
uniref:Uncharacterized protein n=1 Tax=Oreochromis niloticus TaxID=8128 RepID=A0A669CW80_ORENI